MTVSTRYVVQICTEGQQWKDLRKTPRSKSYTLTQAEAVAYMNTQPDSVAVWSGSPGTRPRVTATYRVIKSTCTDGLINQEVVAGNVQPSAEIKSVHRWAADAL